MDIKMLEELFGTVEVVASGKDGESWTKILIPDRKTSWVVKEQS